MPKRIIKAKEPNKTTLKERSFSVRETPFSDFSFILPMLSLKEDIMVGIVFMSVIKPPAATAPAPI